MGTKYFNTQPSLEGLPSNVPRHWHQDLFEAFLVIITVRRSVLPHKDFGCVACPCPQAFCGGPRVATLSLDARSDQCPETANRQGTSERTALQSPSFLEEHRKPLRPEAHEVAGLAERSEEKVDQPDKHVTEAEGRSVTLDCSYTTASAQPNLFWYIQRANDFPKYILRRDKFGTGENGTEFQERFHSELSSNSVPLTIKDLPAVFGNVIKPNKTDVFAEEGSSVTLSCSFSASGAQDYLFWYRQYGRTKPEFLVFIFGSTKKAPSDVDPRFSAEVEKKEQNHVYLNISSAAVSDSALYYCALQPTVTGNTRTLYKNLLQ
ncbi:T-cell receptor alpha chain V region RL-5 [Anabarilius grahami]|nr:T-cell receptor alpha chain V region RL-5 [Anabarilius grahami]